MNKFDELYNALVMEIDWSKLAAAAPGKTISGLGKALSTAGSIAGKGVGALGYAIGTGGRSVPGTQALQTGIQKGTSIVGTGLQKAGAVLSKLSTSQVDQARQSQGEKISKQLGISSKAIPKSGETVGITLGRFAGRGLGVVVPSAMLTKPVAYEGGLLYTVPLRGTAAAGKVVNSMKVLVNAEKKGAVDIFYFDKNNMPIQDTQELGLPKTALLKPNPDKKTSNWILSDRQTAEPEELNLNAAQIMNKNIDVNTIFNYKGDGGKITKYKALTAPDATGNFIALRV